jgi:phosphatidylinositol 3-kinase
MMLGLLTCFLSNAITVRLLQDLLLLDTSCASLIVELPVFDIPILHEETFYPLPQHGACGAVSPVELSAFRKRVAYNNLPIESNFFDPLLVVPFLDYENENDNPVEDKYRTLAHDLLRGLVDPALKPDREQKNRLASIIDSPSHHPTREEKDLLWRFRFSLVDNRRALTKFLLAVDWTMESEVVQAAELLEQWRQRSPIEVTDALKLLGKNVAFQTNLVRDYAIDTLAAAPDSELRLYLLQLVQALKYENVQRAETSRAQVASGSSSVSPSSPSMERVSSLATFLINRAAGNIELANYFYW